MCSSEESISTRISLASGMSLRRILWLDGAFPKRVVYISYIVVYDLLFRRRKRMKMKKIWKRRWLQALRSRDYKQGEGALAKIDTDGKIKNCCLGVLCDVVKKHTGIGEWSKNYGDEFLVFKFKGQRD